MQNSIQTEANHGFKLQFSEDQFLGALLKRDSTELQRILDDRFFGISMLAVPYSKPDLINQICNRANFRSLTSEIFNVIEEKDFVVTTANWTIDVIFDRISVDGLIRATTVWVKRANDWKILSIQLTDARKTAVWRGVLENFATNRS